MTKSFPGLCINAVATSEWHYCQTLKDLKVTLDEVILIAENMAHSEDIQNNNFQLGPSFPTTHSTTGTSAVTTGTATGEEVPFNFQSASVLAQYVARNIDSLGGEESSLSSIGSLTYNDEYLEDPLPELTLENLHIPKDYIDPSLGYVFVNNVGNGHEYLDNSQALLQQLEELGVRVNDDDYSILDFEAHTTSSSVGSVVSNVSDYAPVTASILEGEQDCCDELMTGAGEDNKGDLETETFSILQTPSVPAVCSKVPASRTENVKVDDDEDDFTLDIEDLDHEVAEAEILPSGGVKVTYDNYKKDYRPRISSQQNFLRYLELVHDSVERADDSVKGAGKIPQSVPSKRSLEQYKLLLLSLRKKLNLSEKVNNLSALPNKYSKKIQKLLAEEITYDAMTPDSGVHENFTNLSAEEQEKQREEWKSELAKTEEEIQTLRQVLGSKVKHAQDLKRRLGITVWREFTEDFNQSMKTVRESQTVQKANEVITEFQEAVSSAPLYQKTAGAIGAVGEKTSSLFGGIGAKFGQLKETPTFKSFEERVGGVYSAAKTRMGGSGSNSTQDFEEALKEAEGDKAAANGGTVPTTTTPGTEVSQPAAS